MTGKKLIAVLAISFCWCYLTGEWQHNQKKAIKIKKHGRLSVSLFRYGLDYVQMAILRLIGFGKKEIGRASCRERVLRLV